MKQLSVFTQCTAFRDYGGM